MRSQVNSRNSRRCRRRRRLCTATLVKRQKPPGGRAARFIYVHARLACKSSIRRNIDRQRTTLSRLTSPRLESWLCTHNSRRHRHFSSTRKRRELVTKTREFIIVRYVAMYMRTSLTRSFNHLSLGRADAKIIVVKGDY